MLMAIGVVVAALYLAKGVLVPLTLAGPEQELKRLRKDVS